MTGEKFELHVHDGNNINATSLAHVRVNQWTRVNQLPVAPSSSSGHELYIRFHTGVDSTQARMNFLIKDDRGRKKTAVIFALILLIHYLICNSLSSISSAPSSLALVSP